MVLSGIRDVPGAIIVKIGPLTLGLSAVVIETGPVVAPFGTMAEIDAGLQFVIIAWVPLNLTVPVDVPKSPPVISTDVHTGPALGRRLLTVIDWLDELFPPQPAKKIREVGKQKRNATTAMACVLREERRGRDTGSPCILLFSVMASPLTRIPLTLDSEITFASPEALDSPQRNAKRLSHNPGL